MYNIHKYVQLNRKLRLKCQAKFKVKNASFKL